MGIEWEKLRRFSKAAALFKMILRYSGDANGAELTKVVDLAKNARGKDEDGYRAEFIELVKLCNKRLKRNLPATNRTQYQQEQLHPGLTALSESTSPC